MPTTTDVPGGVPKAILDALELGPGPSRADVLAAARRVLLGDDLVQHDRLMRAVGFTNAAATPSKVLEALSAKMPTASEATGIRAVISGLGLAKDVSADEVVRRLTRLEAADRDSLTRADLASMAAVRRAFGLATTATSSEVHTALRATLTYTTSGDRRELAFAQRHDITQSANFAMSAPILTALGLAADATPADVSAALDKIRQAQKAAEGKATEERQMMDAVRELAGLDATASEDDVVAAIRKLLQSPEIIDAAILSRKLVPAQRPSVEKYAATAGIPALRALIQHSGPYATSAGDIISALASERVRWGRERSFADAMTAVTRAHPELTREYFASKGRSS